MTFAPQLRLVGQESTFYFVGAVQRQVIYRASAESMEQAWEKFRGSSKSGLQVFCVVQNQTEIYLAREQ